MSGLLMLAGGGEFKKGIEIADRFAMESATADPTSLLLVVAIASGQSKAEELARDGSSWLSEQGGLNVGSLVLRDRVAAEDAANVERLAGARLIYIVGGDPSYIPAVLKDTPALAAITQAHQKGAVLAGSGSGAQALASSIYHPESHEIVPGLNFVPNSCVVPYHGSNGRKWVKKLTELLPQAQLLGLDERTAMIGQDKEWRVYGRGWVTIYKNGKPRKFVNGQPFKL